MTFSRSRQSCRTHTAPPSSRMILMALSASARNWAGSGPLNRAWMRPPCPGPRRNLLAMALAFG